MISQQHGEVELIPFDAEACDMETRNLSLRILYTINSSPQYILARSSSLVQVVIVPHVPTTSHYDKSVVAADATPPLPPPEPRPEYGVASLKTCLDTICRSSPELAQDFSRDFSVYVLDPLESNSAPAPVNISSATSGSQMSKPTIAMTEQSHGVAVGLGLMSWALLADENESVTVTGTLVKLPTGQDVLEVIFALRETAAMQKASLPAALRSWGLPPDPSKLSRVHASKSHLAPKHPPKPSAPSDASFSSSPASSIFFQRHDSSHSTFSDYPSSHNTSNTSSTSSTPSPSYHSQPCRSMDDGTRATIASIQRRPKPKPKAKKPTKPAIITEADKLMLTEDVYFGPVRRLGRPPTRGCTSTGSDSMTDAQNAVASSSGSNSPASEDTIIIDDCDEPSRTDSTNNAVPSRGLSRHSGRHSKSPQSKSTRKSSSQAPATHPFVSTPLLRLPRDPHAPPGEKPHEPITLLDVLAYLSASSSSSDPNVQNAALLAALNAIDSTPASGTSSLEKVTNPGLVNALKDLLAAVSQTSEPPRTSDTNPSQPHSNSHHRTHSPDDEVVLLDKENVNPTAFKRRGERNSKVPDPSTSMGEGIAFPSSTSTATPANEPTAHDRSLSTRSNGSSNTVAVAPAPSATIGRKRTLSDFMDEREAGKQKGKAREKEWAERRDAHRHAHSSTRRNSSTDLSTTRHYSRIYGSEAPQQQKRSGTNSYYRTGMEPWTSPPRSRNESHKHGTQDENLQQSSIAASSSSHMHKVAASSPIRSNSAQSQARRRYVVPAWARTETSTLPRLSQEAQRALEEAEERKKARDKEMRRKPRRQRTGRSSSPARPPKRSDTTVVPTRSTNVAGASGPPQPISVTSDHPVFAMTTVIADRISAFSEAARSGSEYDHSPSPSSKIICPSTPPHKRQGNVVSPGDDGSLFTPVPKSCTAMGSARSPFEQRLVDYAEYKDAKMAMEKDTGSIADDENMEADESDEDEEDVLNQELNSALEELDAPSSSLPVATSDAEVNAQSTVDHSTSVDQNSEDDESEAQEAPTRKQHWIGLPPSSPPPPSSPLVMPQDDESDSFSDQELPVATSDAEENNFEFEAPTPTLPIPDLAACTDEELAEYLSTNDLSSLFPPGADQSAFDSSKSNMDIFDQFTNHNAQQSEDGTQNLNVNLEGGFDMFQNGLADFDFTEFWETFKPLVHDHMNGNQPLPSTDILPGQYDNTFGLGGELDHEKLADDVHALFSGCLM